MDLTPNQPVDDAGDLAKTHHLVTAESQGKPICGEASPEALIGSFVEHLDDKREFVREVFGKGGKPALACPHCLSLYPSLVSLSKDERLLKRIIPFNIHIDVSFTPDERASGYVLSARGIAQIGDKRIVVCVSPLLGFTSAHWFYNLSFNMHVAAPLVVPFVNQANKDD